MEKGTAVHKLVRLLVVAAILGLSGCGSSDPILLGHQKLQPTVDHNRAGRAEAFEFTAQHGGKVVRAAVYISEGSDASRVVVGIYRTDVRRQRGGRGSVRVPGRLLTSGSIKAPRAGRWNDVRLQSAHLTAGVHYWIALLGVGGRLSFRDKPGGTVSYTSRHTHLTGLPAIYSPDVRWKSGPASVYVGGFSTGVPGQGAPGSSGPPSSSPAPTAPISPASCSGAKNTPGGPDPFGGCFPGPGNTGVPPGTPLTGIPSQETSGSGWTWSSSDQAVYVNTCGVTLNAVHITGWLVLNPTATNQTFSASTPCVTVDNSEIDGIVQVGGTDGSQAGGPLVLVNDLVNVPTSGMDRSPVLSANYYATGLNVQGARLGFSCRGHCSITNSRAHSGYLSWNGNSGGGYHYNAVGSNGLTGPLTMEHDSLSCDFTNNPSTSADAANSLANGGGCSDDVGLFGDFDPIQNVTIDKNLFVAAPNAYGGVPYCLDGGGQTGKPYPTFSNESVTNNVFQRGSNRKCGLFGPVYSWTSGNGNVWKGNVWDDGAPLAEG